MPTSATTPGLGLMPWLGAVGCALLAATASASNWAFSYHLKLPPPGVVNRSFISLPYVYGPSVAEQLCADLGGASTVASVLRWDEASSTFTSHVCGSETDNFSLQPEGGAYGVVNATGQTIDTLIVGSHDDAFTYSIAPTTGANLTWISIPYHQAIPDVAGTAGVVDAEDLCQSVGPSLAAVMRHDSAVGGYAAYACGSVFDTPFALQLGAGYGLVNAEGQTIAWQPPHY